MLESFLLTEHSKREGGSGEREKPITAECKHVISKTLMAQGSAFELEALFMTDGSMSDCNTANIICELLW